MHNKPYISSLPSVSGSDKPFMLYYRICSAFGDHLHSAFHILKTGYRPQ